MEEGAQNEEKSAPVMQRKKGKGKSRPKTASAAVQTIFRESGESPILLHQI